ncbi:MAG: hypothetical protein WDN28_10765 [Chthoniobacter sp.]
MKFNFFTRFASTACGIVIVTTLLSLLAWCFPDIGIDRRGFNNPQALLSVGGVIVLCWYALIVTCAFLGEAFGRTLAPKAGRIGTLIDLSDPWCYRLFSIIGAGGAAYALFYVSSVVGVGQLPDLIMDGQANQLKMALYDDYSIGLLSLRYAVILSGGLAIYRLITGLSRGLWEALNLGSLLGVGLLSSRLSVVAAIFIACVLYYKNHTVMRIRWGRIIVGGVAIFCLLGFYNMSRNKGYYEKTSSGGFFGSAASEIISYLGVPFQGALATGNNFDKVASGVSASNYNDIDEGLTTNSAFMQLTEKWGEWGFLLVAIISAIAAFIVGFLAKQSRNHFALIGCVLLYCFAEIWRIFLFFEGIVIVLLTVATVVPMSAIFVKIALRNRSQFKGLTRPVGLRGPVKRFSSTGAAR